MVLYICLTDEENKIQKIRFVQGQAAISDMKNQGWSQNNVWYLILFTHKL